MGIPCRLNAVGIYLNDANTRFCRFQFLLPVLELLQARRNIWVTHLCSLLILALVSYERGMLNSINFYGKYLKPAVAVVNKARLGRILLCNI